MEEAIYFEGLESEILEMEKNVVKNKEINFAFAPPFNCDSFFYEDDSESQEDENDSKTQVSQRDKWLIKHKKHG